MRFIALSLLVLLSCLIGCNRMVPSVQHLDNLPSLDLSESQVPVYGALIKLAETSGRAFCSGTVISKNYAITAAHCIHDDSYHLSTEEIKIYSATGQDTGVTAIPAGMHINADYGVLIGDFSKFHRVALADQGTPLWDLAQVGADLTVCGFPYGTKGSVCQKMLKIRPIGTMYGGLNATLPGMSGGPVFVDTFFGPIQVAVITGYIEGDGLSLGLVSPLTGILDTLHIER